MLDYFFEVDSLVDQVSELDPKRKVLKCRRVHNRVVEDQFTKLHKLVNLLNITWFTMVMLLLSSNLKQMLVMYSTYLILFL